MSKRRNLVIARVGDGSEHPHWLNGPGEERNWDLIVSYWGDDPEVYRGGDWLRIDRKGLKYEAVNDLILTNGELVRSYDYVWLAEDDLACTCQDINRFFDVCHQERLDLAYRAKTAGDLRPLTMDLPGGAHPGRQVGGGWPGSAAPTTGPTSFTAPASPAQAGNWSGPASWAPASVVFGGLGFAFAVNVVIWALVSATSGQLVYFWPIWIALPMLVSLLARAFVWTGGPPPRFGSRLDYRMQRRAERRRRWSGWG